jgi:hypothetical protein
MKRPARSARTRIAHGIYRDAYGYSVMASVGSGTRRLSSEIRFPRGTELTVMKARWQHEKERLKTMKAITTPQVARSIDERLVCALERIADQLEKHTQRIDG